MKESFFKIHRITVSPQNPLVFHFVRFFNKTWADQIETQQAKRKCREKITFNLTEKILHYEKYHKLCERITLNNIETRLFIFHYPK